MTKYPCALVRALARCSLILLVACFGPVSLSVAAGPQVTTPVGTTTTLISSAGTVTLGDTVTFTATVTPASGTPTGLVTFFDGATPLGSGALNEVVGNDQANFSTSLLSAAASPHSITAVYQTDGTFAGSTSAAITGATATASLNVEAPVMAITKSHTGTLSSGQTGAVYTITVSNTGTGNTVGPVTVVDTLPAVPNTLVPVALGGTGWSCDLPSLTCTRTDALAAGTSYPSITLTVNIPQNIANHFVNTATVSGGGDANNHSATDGVTLVGKPILITSTDSGAVTIVPGMQATFSFNVDATALNPPPSVLVFSCGGLPKGTACIFSPLAEGQPFSQLTLTITRLGRGNSLPFLPLSQEPPRYLILLLSLLGLAAFGLRERQGRKLRVRLAVALMGLMVLMTMWGCGGNPLVTPPGTYTITVTATEDPASGNASGSTTVTLRVL